MYLHILSWKMIMPIEGIDRFPMSITIKSIEHSDPSHQGSMTAKSETARREGRLGNQFRWT